MQDYPAAAPRQDEQMTMGESNGIIMVESNPRAFNSSQSSTATDGGKKKNKKKKAKAEASDNAQQQQQHQQANVDRMVTLKNPMFFNNPTEPVNPMMRNSTPPFVSPMATEPSSASIIRQENGMYTIRNPSFQNAFGASNPSAPFVPRPQMEAIGRPFAPSQFNSSFENEGPPPTEASQPKCSSVIGSEMKNVLQRRKEQEFAATMDPYQQYGMRPNAAYSHFGGPGMNFNNNGTHCDDSFMQQSSSGGFPSYPSQMMSNYDDLRLQPGQMLNSEVISTIAQFELRIEKLNFIPGHNPQRHRVEDVPESG